MSFNLIDYVKQTFTSEVLTRAATFLGESETSLNKAWTAIVTIVAGGILDKAGTPEGQALIFKLTGYYHDQVRAGNTYKFFAEEGHLADVQSVSAELFDNKTAPISHLISNFSGILPGSAIVLMNIAATASLGLLGQYSVENNLSNAEMVQLLHEQESSIRNSIPSGLDLRDVFEPVPQQHHSFNSSPTTHNKQAMENNHHDEHKTILKPGRFIFPIVLLSIIVLISFYAIRGGHEHDKDFPGLVVNQDTRHEEILGLSPMNDTLMNKVDADTTGKYKIDSVSTYPKQDTLNLKPVKKAAADSIH